jgi:hypothetical protein
MEGETMTTFSDTTEERYFEMLGVLPPEAYGAGGFLVGEPVNHRNCEISGRLAPTFDAFFSIGDQYYASDEPMTVKEFAKVKKADIVSKEVTG